MKLGIRELIFLVLMGGLVASTLVTLFVMPALYLIVGAGAERHSDLALDRP